MVALEPLVEAVAEDWHTKQVALLMADLTRSQLVEAELAQLQLDLAQMGVIQFLTRLQPKAGVAEDLMTQLAPQGDLAAEPQV